MSDVFLVYSQKFQREAEALACELKRLDVSAWVASINIGVGESAEQKVFEAIRNSRLIAFIAGPRVSAGPWVQREYMAALEQSWSDRNKLLVPVLIGSAAPPAFLRHGPAVKVGGRKPDWASAAREIKKLLSGERSIKRSKAPVKEQRERLDLIEREANALRVQDVEPLHKS